MKKKKYIKINFDTPKSVFKDGFESLRYKKQLYQKSSIQRVEEELRKYEIIITEKEILEKYQLSYSVQNLTDEYNAKYESELDELAKLKLLFDDDCIFLFIDKVIRESFYVQDLPDPDFLVFRIRDFDKVSKKNKPKEIICILKIINEIKKYYPEKNLNKIFRRTLLDIEGVISDLIGIEAHNCFLSYDDCKEIVSEAFKIMNNYEIDEPIYIYNDCLCLLAKFGYEKVKDKFEEGLKKYPHHKLKMYNAVIIELWMYSKKVNDYTDVIRLYDEAMKILVFSEDEYEYRKIIQENFSIDIESIRNRK